MEQTEIHPDDEQETNTAEPDITSTKTNPSSGEVDPEAVPQATNFTDNEHIDLSCNGGLVTSKQNPDMEESGVNSPVQVGQESCETAGKIQSKEDGETPTESEMDVAGDSQRKEIEQKNYPPHPQDSQDPENIKQGNVETDQIEKSKTPSDTCTADSDIFADAEEDTSIIDDVPRLETKESSSSLGSFTVQLNREHDVSLEYSTEDSIDTDCTLISIDEETEEEVTDSERFESPILVDLIKEPENVSLSKDGVIRCEPSGFSTEEVKDICNHAKKYETVNFQCQLCEYSTSEASEATKHFAETWVGTECWTAAAGQLHIHTCELFQCGICKAHFVDICSAQSHQYSLHWANHKKASYSCDICDVKCDSLKDFVAHTEDAMHSLVFSGDLEDIQCTELLEGVQELPGLDNSVMNQMNSIEEPSCRSPPPLGLNTPKPICALPPPIMTSAPPVPDSPVPQTLTQDGPPPLETVLPDDLPPLEPIPPGDPGGPSVSPPGTLPSDFFNSEDSNSCFGEAMEVLKECSKYDPMDESLEEKNATEDPDQKSEKVTENEEAMEEEDEEKKFDRNESGENGEISVSLSNVETVEKYEENSADPPGELIIEGPSPDINAKEELKAGQEDSVEANLNVDQPDCIGATPDSNREPSASVVHSQKIPESSNPRSLLRKNLASTNAQDPGAAEITDSVTRDITSPNVPASTSATAAEALIIKPKPNRVHCRKVCNILMRSKIICLLDFCNKWNFVSLPNLQIF